MTLRLDGLNLMKKNKKYKNREWLLQKYCIEGMGAKNIANLCNVNYYTIIKWIDFFDIERKTQAEQISGSKNGRWKEPEINDYELLYKDYVIDKMFISDIAKKYKKTKFCITQSIKKHGIKLRSVKENNILINKRNRKRYFLKYKNKDNFIENLLRDDSWKSGVLTIDEYRCRFCGNKNNLNVHHIVSSKRIKNIFLNEHKALNISDRNAEDFYNKIIIDYRFGVENGVVLCEECHKKYHKKFINLKHQVDKVLVDRIIDEHSFYGRIDIGFNRFDTQKFIVFSSFPNRKINGAKKRGYIFGETFRIYDSQVLLYCEENNGYY